MNVETDSLKYRVFGSVVLSGDNLATHMLAVRYFHWSYRPILPQRLQRDTKMVKW